MRALFIQVFSRLLPKLIRPPGEYSEATKREYEPRAAALSVNVYLNCKRRTCEIIATEEYVCILGVLGGAKEIYSTSAWRGDEIARIDQERNAAAACVIIVEKHAAAWPLVPAGEISARRFVSIAHLANVSGNAAAISSARGQAVRAHHRRAGIAGACRRAQHPRSSREADIGR